MAKEAGLIVAPWIRKAYKGLVRHADTAFQTFAKRHKALRCGPRCTECCHAIFGLFPLEAVLIHEAYQALNQDIKKKVQIRALEALDALRFLNNLSAISGEELLQRIPRIKIRCPFLGDDELCAIYSKRPLTCRVYGIPLLLRGKVRRCAGSVQDEEHSVALDMDDVHKKLYELSSAFLEDNLIFDREKPRLLLSVSYAILKPYDVLMDHSAIRGL